LSENRHVSSCFTTLSQELSVERRGVRKIVVEILPRNRSDRLLGKLGGDRWHRHKRRWEMDAADGAQADRLGRRLPSKRDVPAPRPRSSVHSGVRSNPAGARGEVREDSGSKPKLQPARRAVCANGPRRVLPPFRSLRGTAFPVPAQRASGPLPSGTLSPGAQRTADRGERRFNQPEGGSWQGRLPVSARRHPELLSSRGGLPGDD